MKFRFDDETEKKIVAKGAKFIKEKRFTDIYLDSGDYFLTCRDIWLRRRDSAYECKVGMRDPQGVDRYNELTTDGEIKHFLASLKESGFKIDQKKSNTSPSHVHAVDEFSRYLSSIGLNPFASIATHRRTFKLDEFTIDLDHMDFGYRIGEVELIVANDRAEDASNKIVAFCRSMGLDNAPPIFGKVLQYIKTERADHYQALLNAGLIGLKVMHT